MSDDCLFCKIADKKIPSHKVYEDDEYYAFLNIKPYAKGHTLVIPKRHHRNILDFKDNLGTYMERVRSVAQRIQKALDMPDFTLINRCGKSAGQEMQHVHFHIIPSSPENPKVFSVDTIEDDLARTAQLLRDAKEK
ncbi:MAG: HIT family protein [Nanoarchaeota archaeon]